MSVDWLLVEPGSSLSTCSCAGATRVRARTAASLCARGTSARQLIALSGSSRRIGGTRGGFPRTPSVVALRATDSLSALKGRPTKPPADWVVALRATIVSGGAPRKERPSTPLGTGGVSAALREAPPRQDSAVWPASLCNPTSGAKAPAWLLPFSARLKPCPDESCTVASRTGGGNSACPASGGAAL